MVSRDSVVGGENKPFMVKDIIYPGFRGDENTLVMVTVLVLVSPKQDKVYLMFYII